jgi:AhpD family alkylhydroperoxidase
VNTGQFDDTVPGMTTLNRLDIEKDAPALYRAYLRLDGAVAQSALPRPLAELVRIRASQINGCAYCVEMHTRDALAAGESTSRLFAVTAWRESPLFDERERAALALTDAVTRISDPAPLDDAYEAAAEQFSPEELAALLYAIVTINGWNRLAVTTHMVFEG